MQADDRMFELRLYDVAPGRMADMMARVTDHLSALFPRHGVHPLASWVADTGPDLPSYIYLTPWRDLVERGRCWAGFYVDPDWIAARNRTNAASELVEAFDVIFMRAIHGWVAATEPGTDQVVELAIQEAKVGQTALVRETLLAHEGPALRRAGATVLGMFEVVSGRKLPSVVSLVSWPRSGQAEARARYEADADLRTARAAQITALGRCVLGRASTWSMTDFHVEWATVPSS